MINTARSYNIDDYMEILRRRIWYIIIPFLVIMIGTVLYAIFAARLYKASTLVLVTQQKVPETFVQSTITSNIEERLQTISKEVLSRTRLEQIIDEFHLYKNQNENKTREEVVEQMREHIKVEFPKRDEKGYFTISFIGEDPNVVTAIANRLSSLFIEEHLRFREQQAVGTTEFLTSELATKRVKLEQLEAALTEYKKLHTGELPEQRDTNLRILEQMQNQSQRVGENLRAALDRKLFLQKQLSDLEMPSPDNMATGKNSRISSPSTALTYSSSNPQVTGTYSSMKDSYSKQLEDLRSKYTENHPDVKSIKKKLADLELKKDTDTYNVKNDPRYKELKNQLTMTDMEVKRFQHEDGNLGGQLNKYRGRIENVFSREQEMASLNREYQNTKEMYENLMKKTQEAQQAENLERRQKGEQFKILDPARLPERPFSPDIPKTFLMGFVMAICCSFASAFIREQLDRSFHDAGDVEVTLGMRVLATIPKIQEAA